MYNTSEIPGILPGSLPGLRVSSLFNALTIIPSHASAQSAQDPLFETT